MIKSYTRTTLRGNPAVDTTPQQWFIDLRRCRHCRDGEEHSEWAHEDAVEESEEAWMDGMVKETQELCQKRLRENMREKEK